MALFYEPKLDRNILIGTNPKLAEQLIDNCLKQNNLWFLKDYQEYKRERKIENTNSRFDFAGVDKEGKPFVLEIKNVPLADYVDCTEKDKKKECAPRKEKPPKEKRRGRGRDREAAGRGMER